MLKLFARKAEPTFDDVAPQHIKDARLAIAEAAVRQFRDAAAAAANGDAEFAADWWFKAQRLYSQSISIPLDMLAAEERLKKFQEIK